MRKSPRHGVPADFYARLNDRLTWSQERHWKAVSIDIEDFARLMKMLTPADKSPADSPALRGITTLT